MITIKANDIVQCELARDGLVYRGCYRVRERNGAFIWVLPCDDIPPPMNIAFSISLFVLAPARLRVLC